MKKWADLVLEGTVKFGRDCDAAKNYSAWLAEAGFTDVVELRYKWPQNRWPKDRKLKELGKARCLTSTLVPSCLVTSRGGFIPYTQMYVPEGRADQANR